MFANRKTAILALHSMSKTTNVQRSQPLIANTIKKDNTDSHIQLAYGLVQVLNFWVRAQHDAETNMTTGLTDDQELFLQQDRRKFGCNLPPATKLVPDLSDFHFKPHVLDTEALETITKCINILQTSFYSWSAQYKSSNTQHHSGVAAGLLALLNDTEIYTQYLGEHSIWKLFKDTLDIVHKFCPGFFPWHGVVTDKDRANNDKQVVIAESLEGMEIGGVIGAEMADQASTLNQKYQVGLKKVWNAIVEMSSFEYEDKHYLSDDVRTQTENLFQASNYIIHTLNE